METDALHSQYSVGIRDLCLQGIGWKPDHIWKVDSLSMIALIKPLVHYGLHFVFPAFIAWRWKGESFSKVYLLMLSTMLVDLDHLLAVPVFDPCRCSIGFHPLHSGFAISIYILMLFFKRTRIVGVGLVLHMLTDWQDCLWT